MSVTMVSLPLLRPDHFFLRLLNQLSHFPGDDDPNQLTEDRSDQSVFSGGDMSVNFVQFQQISDIHTRKGGKKTELNRI